MLKERIEGELGISIPDRDWSNFVRGVSYNDLHVDIQDAMGRYAKTGDDSAITEKQADYIVEYYGPSLKRYQISQNND